MHRPTSAGRSERGVRELRRRQHPGKDHVRINDEHQNKERGGIYDKFPVYRAFSVL
jgi:hypothetical protein